MNTNTLELLRFPFQPLLPILSTQCNVVWMNWGHPGYTFHSYVDPSTITSGSSVYSVWVVARLTHKSSHVRPTWISSGESSRALKTHPKITHILKLMPYLFFSAMGFRLITLSTQIYMHPYIPSICLSMCRH